MNQSFAEQHLDLQPKGIPTQQSIAWHSLRRTILGIVAATGALLATTGCVSGTNGNPVSSGNQYSGSTPSTLLITATNNAQIPIFKFNLQAVSLVATNGSVVPLLTSPQVIELGSLSGVARPLATADVPQGTYTSVKLTYSPAEFVVIDQSGGPGTIDTGTYNINTPGAQPTTVPLQLTTPLTVTGSAMGLLLNLNIPKSTTYIPFSAGSTVIQPNGGNTTFSPVYSFSGITLAAQPSTLLDGKVEDVHGQVTASSSGILTITSNTGAVLNFDTTSSTIFAGAGGAATPPVGSFVDVDAALQQDGSMLATRIQTESLTQLYDIVGQAIQYSESLYLQNMGRELQGPNLPGGTGSTFSSNVQFASPAQFNIAWPKGAMPAGLPFTPALNPASIFIGQNLATPINTLQVNSTIPAASFVTLEPQTLNATVMSVSTTNGLTTYQVNLFANDFITIFGPSAAVTVYATSDTHTITSSTLASGSIGRFRGLLFNDRGTLRMVATEIEDGVPGS